MATPEGQPPCDQPPGPKLKRGTLASIVGVGAAALLFQLVPTEESGRTVKVAIATDGQATLTHVSGPEYLTTYRDIAGIPTACDGLTHGIKPGQHYTEAQCTAMLEGELVQTAEKVVACAPVLRRPGMEGALVGSVVFAYNVGTSGFCHSSAQRLFNQGQIAQGCHAFLAWDKARVHGVLRPVAGLTARRKREAKLCLSSAS